MFVLSKGIKMYHVCNEVISHNGSIAKLCDIRSFKAFKSYQQCEYCPHKCTNLT